MTRAAVPVCGYTARQMRGAYGLTAADTGKGTTVALTQAGVTPHTLAALSDYTRRNGLPAPRSGQYREDDLGHGDVHRTCDSGDANENDLDAEALYAMAPGADQLMVDGDACAGPGQAVLDARLAPLTGKGTGARVAIESSSNFLRIHERLEPASDLKAVHAIAMRAAAEGVSMLNISDDTPGVGVPASDPDITAVGGTTLGLGAHGQRLFETGWSTDMGERSGQTGAWHDLGVRDAAGGGASVRYGEPGYQKGVVPRAMSTNSTGHAGRTVPDIAADADPSSGMSTGVIVVQPNGKTSPYTPFVGSGTSQATPLVAGIVADAEQGGRTHLGFLNPRLYSLAGTTAFHDIVPLGPSAPETDRAFYAAGSAYGYGPGVHVGINDAQDRRGTRQVTAPGYDTMTGLGTPNGQAFIRGLRSGR